MPSKVGSDVMEPVQAHPTCAESAAQVQHGATPRVLCRHRPFVLKGQYKQTVVLSLQDKSPLLPVKPWASSKAKMYSAFSAKTGSSRNNVLVYRWWPLRAGADMPCGCSRPGWSGLDQGFIHVNV